MNDRVASRAQRSQIGQMADVRYARDAQEWMDRFADRTGLTSGRPPRRYLWTDAFAVCSFLGLERAIGDGRHLELAIRLVDQVHHTLGRYRAGDVRSGWLSGLGEQEGEAHPTRGGLRIGKRLPERRPDEPFDDRLEWERDGQYFHYLTKWMHALDQVTRATGHPTFNTWARVLAEAAHHAFTYGPSGSGRRMYWKMSIDLSRPLVSSMGQHDPLDGFVTYTELDATARVTGAVASGPDLAAEAADFFAMTVRGGLATPDPLGLGGLLADAFCVDQLRWQNALPSGEQLLGDLLEAALAGLRQYVQQPDLRSSAESRLAFRELGLAIGLAAVERMAERAASAPERSAATVDAAARVAPLMRYLPLRREIESFWLEPGHRRAETWLEHEDINEVMLATSLAPDGFLSPITWSPKR